ncbi:MAG: hypothetical protein TU35_005780 [Thermoproteus sp. AZ2]|uniref:Uncharacterized protein n=1 Tax=Thermoproteus sp. AZ2 TaxID=1609232 RepID=A0ACC6V1W6_9CREN
MYQETNILLNKAREIARGLAAELAYLTLVGTLVVPPRSLLRLPLVKALPPEVFSAIAFASSGDDLTLKLNSSLGMRLGGVPACKRLDAELAALCRALAERGGEPIYEALDVLPSLGATLSSIDVPEGDLLMSAYRALAGAASEHEYARLFKAYDEWGLYAVVGLNARRSGQRP